MTTCLSDGRQTMTTLVGNDVSRWNVGAHPVADFLLAKATQGEDYTDPSFSAWASGARVRGQLFGAYFWGNGASAQKEAQYFLDHCDHRPGDIMMLDAESKPGIFSLPDPVGWCLSALSYVKVRSGVTPVIYLNRSTAEEYDWSRVIKGGYPLWLAQYHDVNNVPAPPIGWGGYVAWQWGGTGIDSDIFYGNANDWKRLGGASIPIVKDDDMDVDQEIPFGPGSPGVAPHPTTAGNALGNVSYQTQVANNIANNQLAALQATNAKLDKLITLLTPKA